MNQNFSHFIINFSCLLISIINIYLFIYFNGWSINNIFIQTIIPVIMALFWYFLTDKHMLEMYFLKVMNDHRLWALSLIYEQLRQKEMYSDEVYFETSSEIFKLLSKNQIELISSELCMEIHIDKKIYKAILKRNSKLKSYELILTDYGRIQSFNDIKNM